MFFSPLNHLRPLAELTPECEYLSCAGETRLDVLSQRGLTSAKQREWSLLSLGVTRIQPRLKPPGLLWSKHTVLIEVNLSTWTSSFFFLQSSFPEIRLQPVWVVRGRSIPDGGIPYLLLLFASPGSCQPISPGCSGPSDGLPCHPAHWQLLPVLCYLQNWQEHSPIIQIVNEDISADPGTDPRGTPLEPDCRVDFASIVIIDDSSLDMPETSRSVGDLCVLFTFVVRAPVERQMQSTKKVL